MYETKTATIKIYVLKKKISKKHLFQENFTVLQLFKYLLIEISEFNTYKYTLTRKKIIFLISQATYRKKNTSIV